MLAAVAIGGAKIAAGVGAVIGLGSMISRASSAVSGFIDALMPPSGKLISGSPNVFIGSGQSTLMDIADDFSGWQKALLIGVEFLVPPTRGGISGLAKLIRNPSGAFKGAMAGFSALKKRLAQDWRCFKSAQGFRQTVKKLWKGDPINVVTGEIFDQRRDLEVGHTHRS